MIKIILKDKNILLSLFLNNKNYSIVRFTLNYQLLRNNQLIINKENDLKYQPNNFRSIRNTTDSLTF
ncbi:hypothetical protein SAMN03080602_02648 [Arenibacter troitsensis]|uniref:Uncharacterized protein n=1 Tax=Arenibacter troitsensis TaxID=188872 RepID=A0A1X7KA93_9FLAO|nr:hypothetical protein SAMN03080602_02648 [Arenibacter troitsensis]